MSSVIGRVSIARFTPDIGKIFKNSTAKCQRFQIMTSAKGTPRESIIIISSNLFCGPHKNRRASVNVSITQLTSIVTSCVTTESQSPFPLQFLRISSKRLATESTSSERIFFFFHHSFFKFVTSNYAMETPLLIEDNLKANRGIEHNFLPRLSLATCWRRQTKMSESN